MIRQITLATLGIGALFVSGSAFVEGTAEAHCGGHAGSCGGDFYTIGAPYKVINESCTVGSFRWYHPYCNRPIANCSPGASCPCADCPGGTNESCHYMTQNYASDCL